jgi:transposase InsO family protein
MTSISLLEHAWELHKAGLSVEQIAPKIGKHRSTVFRWFAGIKLKGIVKFVREYKLAKTGRRQKRKTDPITKARIYAIREEYRRCCGEKIQYWMIQRHGQRVGLATIYRVLGEKYQLRSKWKKNIKRGPVPKATKPREFIQVDTVDFGELFAFTAIDTFTREAWVVIEDKLNAKAGERALRQHFTYFNFSEIIQRDGGCEFEAEWEQAAKSMCKRIRTSRPYRKNDQAFIEVFNRTLRKECLGWQKYKRSDIYRVRAKVLDFLDYYNNTRPHLSLNLQAPKVYLSHLR